MHIKSYVAIPSDGFMNIEHAIEEYAFSDGAIGKNSTILANCGRRRRLEMPRMAVKGNRHEPPSRLSLHRRRARRLHRLRKRSNRYSRYRAEFLKNAEAQRRLDRRDVGDG